MQVRFGKVTLQHAEVSQPKKSPDSFAHLQVAVSGKQDKALFRQITETLSKRDLRQAGVIDQNKSGPWHFTLGVSPKGNVRVLTGHQSNGESNSYVDIFSTKRRSDYDLKSEVMAMPLTKWRRVLDKVLPKIKDPAIHAIVSDCLAGPNRERDRSPVV